MNRISLLLFILLFAATPGKSQILLDTEFDACDDGIIKQIEKRSDTVIIMGEYCLDCNNVEETLFILYSYKREYFLKVINREVLGEKITYQYNSDQEVNGRELLLHLNRNFKQILYEFNNSAVVESDTIIRDGIAYLRGLPAEGQKYYYLEMKLGRLNTKTTMYCRKVDDRFKNRLPNLYSIIWFFKKQVSD